MAPHLAARRRARARRGPSRRPRRSSPRRRCSPTDRVYPSPSLGARRRRAAADSLVLTHDRAGRTAGWRCGPTAQTVINRVLAEGESQTLEAHGEIVLSVGNAGGPQHPRERPPGAAPGQAAARSRKNIVITRQNLPSLVEQDGAGARRRSQRLAPMAEARATNPLVEQFRRGGVARDLRLMAAQGLLPLKPEDLVEMWTDLVARRGRGGARGGRQSLSALPGRRAAADPEEPRHAARRAGLGRHPPRRARAARGRAAEHLAARRDDRGARRRRCRRSSPSSWSSTRRASCAAPRCSWRSRRNAGLNNDQKRRLRELRETFQHRRGGGRRPPPRARRRRPPRRRRRPSPSRSPSRAVGDVS